MNTCDVLIAGGGPAGSACAWRLRQAGIDVLVMDKAVFPRDKVCAGWITPQVLDDLQIDPNDYRKGRTFQPITGFRVGVIGEDHLVEASYAHAVSFGIRRCEFDDYLLRRSKARLVFGGSISAVRRESSQWIVNETVTAPMLVGAGGHFCPVARMLNGASDHAPLVAAQEAELAIEHWGCNVTAETPELYFSRDLAGYGWCFRKGDYINIGLGRLDHHGLPSAITEFVDFLKMRRRIPADASPWRWRGHAYLLSGTSSRRVVDDAVMLSGDAAGLASTEWRGDPAGKSSPDLWRRQRLSRRTAVTPAIGWSRTPDSSSSDLARVHLPICCRASFQEGFRSLWPSGCSRSRGSCDTSCSIGGFCTRDEALALV
jgi:flavin-dependent dehydrogenase